MARPGLCIRRIILGESDTTAVGLTIFLALTGTSSGETGDCRLRKTWDDLEVNGSRLGGVSGRVERST